MALRERGKLLNPLIERSRNLGRGRHPGMLLHVRGNPRPWLRTRGVDVAGGSEPAGVIQATSLHEVESRHRVGRGIQRGAALGAERPVDLATAVAHGGIDFGLPPFDREGVGGYGRHRGHVGPGHLLAVLAVAVGDKDGLRSGLVANRAACASPFERCTHR